MFKTMLKTRSKHGMFQTCEHGFLMILTQSGPGRNGGPGDPEAEPADHSFLLLYSILFHFITIYFIQFDSNPERPWQEWRSWRPRS